MKKEAGWKMYIKLQELLNLGLNKSQIARHLGISRPTLYEYLNLTPDEFEQRLNTLSGNMSMTYERSIIYLKA